MFDLTGFQRDLLYVVAGLDEPNGLELKEELEKGYDGEVHHGRLYPNLDALCETGLVSKDEADKRTNIYRLTDRGAREIESRRGWENQYAAEVAEGA